MRRKRAEARKTKKRKLARKRASNAPPLIEIRAAEVITVNTDEVGVVLSEEQRSLLKRGLERVLSVAYALDIGVEVAPDGTVRYGVRRRS